MSILGAYPLTVYVANIFPPASDAVLTVNHYHHPTYYDSEVKNYVVESIPSADNVAEYSIQPGCQIAFPLTLGDEFLEITLNGSYPGIYWVQVGAKSGCTICDLNGKSFAPTIPTDFGEKKDANGNLIYYKGGTWQFSEEQNLPEQWTLKILKYNFDPETENVVIGPSTPG